MIATRHTPAGIANTERRFIGYSTMGGTVSKLPDVDVSLVEDATERFYKMKTITKARLIRMNYAQAT